jgi:DNA-binding response OmpR family regulator
MVIELAPRAHPSPRDASASAPAGSAGPAAREDDIKPAPPDQRPIVVIDDDSNHLELLVTCLERAGLRASGFTQSRAALYYLLDHPAALAVVDLYMPDMDGIEIVRRLQGSVPNLPLIGMTGARDRRSSIYLSSLRDFGARTCLRKPVEAARFLNAVRAAMR